MNSPIPNCHVYRAYVVGPSGQFLLAHELNCKTDEEAISKAKENTNGNAVELWDRGRKIAFIAVGGFTCRRF